MLIIHIGLLPFRGKTGFQNEDAEKLLVIVFFTESPAFLKGHFDMYKRSESLYVYQRGLFDLRQEGSCQSFSCMQK